MVRDNWDQDTLGALCTKSRVTEKNVYDGSGSRRRTTVSFSTFTLPGGATCSLPSDVREYSADAGSVLRHTHLDYRTNPGQDALYLDRRIIGLLKDQMLYEVSGGVETLVSKVGFSYDDGSSIQGADAPVRHDNDNYGPGFVVGRGNVTSVKRYDVTDLSQSTTTSMKYNRPAVCYAQIRCRIRARLVTLIHSPTGTTIATLRLPKTVTNRKLFLKLHL